MDQVVEPVKITKLLLLEPEGIFHRFWDSFMMVTAFVNAFTIPIDLAFNPYWMTYWWYAVIEHIIDFCFLLDIIVLFRTALVDDDGNFITSSKIIAKTYIKG